MRTKIIFSLSVLLVLCTVIMIACGTDVGEPTVSIPFSLTVDSVVRYIQIDDSSNFNGAIMNKVTAEIYCTSGPSRVITLPEELKWALMENESLTIDVAVICDMGQEKFDEFLSFFRPAEPVK
ncbi:hypothetical protein A2415_02680 [candidate division WWE3 bacterium RIFOXYC1_FULL_39_7]|uniref:Uncharacterized protein n=2 Tax=Katanobacteria TaxID=422282 RepID=A0A1F4X525_UNCKA|nr:MAG: hypothetical protein A2415_02680 [candidate division WWE3 bacterium RIFOXYC1_FULL_39_7]OGC76641.1 MAG: hypothetical protein A2619_04305 [candidate division WWE3 bacterium RIFOXYD1_FULL_39_9]